MKKDAVERLLICAMTDNAAEIVALRDKNAELVAVLEMIAGRRYDGNQSAASLAKSALDTMRLLNDPDRRTD